MFWHEETPIDQFQVPKDIIDLVFDIECKELPVDHAYALSTAITTLLPWIKHDSNISIHTVHVAGSQNGWERPPHGTNNHLILSRRAKLTIRTSLETMNALQNGLTGTSLDINGCTMLIGPSHLKPMSKNSTLFSRHVAIATREDEVEFLQWAAAELKTIDITIRKAICGKTVELKTPIASISTRSLLLADLSLEESIRLQQHGLGEHKLLGCGIFIPHKGISAVKKIESN